MIKKLLLLLFICTGIAASQILDNKLQNNSLLGNVTISVTVGGTFPFKGTFPALITERLDEFITRLYNEAVDLTLRTTNDPELYRKAKEQVVRFSLRGIKLKRITGEELIIDLGDQYLDLTGFSEFVEKNKEICDGIIPSFEAYYWNQGYMIIGEDGFVKRVSEKDRIPISTHSTACISYFKKGKDFVKYAEQMIMKKRTATNGAYLPSLVYNEMIEDGRKILTCPCELIVNLGKIEGVNVFEQINRPLRWKKK